MRTLFYRISYLLIILLISLSVSVLADQNPVIYGELIDNHDQSSAGVEIAVVDTSGSTVKSAVSDSTGRFLISNINRGYFDLVIKAGKYHAMKIRKYHIDPDTAQYVKIKLLPVKGFECDSCDAGTISGRIIDSESNEGVPGVEVIIDIDHKAISTFDGSYRIENLRSGKYDIRAITMGYSPVTIENVIVNSDKAYIIDLPMLFGVDTKAPKIIVY